MGCSAAPLSILHPVAAWSWSWFVTFHTFSVNTASSPSTADASLAQSRSLRHPQGLLSSFPFRIKLFMTWWFVMLHLVNIKYQFFNCLLYFCMFKGLLAFIWLIDAHVEIFIVIWGFLNHCIPKSCGECRYSEIRKCVIHFSKSSNRFDFLSFREEATSNLNH